MRGRRVLAVPAAVVLAALLALTGCSGKVADVAQAPPVKVDTPALRTLKASAGIAPCPATSGTATDDGLPDVALPCLGGGRSVDVARLRGPLVVNLFAQWCGPCRKELPYFQAFSTTYADKVGVLGVDWQDTQPAQALELARATGVTYPLLVDAKPSIRVGQGLPVTILIDADGKVVYQRPTVIGSEVALEKLVAEHLGVQG